MPPVPVHLPFAIYFYAGMLVAALLIIWWGRLSARQAGWRWGGGRALLLGIGWGSLLSVAGIAWLRFLLHTGRYLPVPTQPTPLDWGLFVVVIPVVEELCFRGAVFAGLQRTWSLFWSVFLSALLSVLCLPQHRGLAFVFLGGIGYALAFRASGSIVAPILAHALVAVTFLLGHLHPAAVSRVRTELLGIVGGLALAVILFCWLSGGKKP